MSEAPEQIGGLVYLPNPDYPYPFEVERPPHFWMTEQTGVLSAAVETYLNGDPLTPVALDLIKQYLRQYLSRALMSGDAKRDLLLRKSAGLRSNREIDNFIEEIAEYGVEPF